MGIFNNAKSITMNNKVVSSITTDTGVLYQKKVNTQLSIDVPLNLTYSDDFSITGTLSSNGVGVVGATVNLLVGSTVVDFTTTTTGGAYSFNNTPVSAGNHSFQVVFNGNSEYFASESTIVNRVVAKETSVLLNVTQTGKIGFASTGTGYNSVTPACILRTDDDEAIAFATIHFGDDTDSTQVDGYAQGNDVTYPTTSLNMVYDGDSNYTASSVTANFEYQIPTLLNLSGTKTIISKDETATVNGMLYDQDGDIIPNCQLEYNIKHNNTIITSGTVRTDNNGAITLNYTGTGAGDVDITVSYGRLLQETFVIEDLPLYADTTKVNNWRSVSNNNGYTYLSDYELPIGNTVELKFNSMPSNFMVGLFNLNGTTRINTIVIQQEGSGRYIYKASGYETFSTPITTSTIVKIKAVSSTQFEFYLNDTLIKTITNSVENSRMISIHKYNGKTYNLDYVKVKAL